MGWNRSTSTFQRWTSPGKDGDGLRTNHFYRRGLGSQVLNRDLLVKYVAVEPLDQPFPARSGDYKEGGIRIQACEATAGNDAASIVWKYRFEPFSKWESEEVVGCQACEGGQGDPGRKTEAGYSG